MCSRSYIPIKISITLSSIDLQIYGSMVKYFNYDSNKEQKRMNEKQVREALFQEKAMAYYYM